MLDASNTAATVKACNDAGSTGPFQSPHERDLRVQQDFPTLGRVDGVKPFLLMEVGVMPREQITHNELRIPVAEALMGDGAEAPQGNGRNVHVGWNANTGYVQVSVEAGQEDVKRLAEPSEDVGYGTGGIHVWSEVLTRRDVNKLIQTLRTARDKAYGRDE